MSRIKVTVLVFGLEIAAILIAGMGKTVAGPARIGSALLASDRLGGPSLSPAATPDCSLAWQWVDTPNSTPAPAGFSGVAAISAGEVWTVGQYVTGIPLTERWNGSSWNFVPAANPGSGGLAAVFALSSTDMWATGLNYTDNATLIEHWDGNQWSIVAGVVLTESAELHGVAAASTNDVWAVGNSPVTVHGYGVDQTLVEHWDGSAWSRTPSANINPPGDYSPNYLVGVSAISTDDVWAVGYYQDSTTRETRSLIEHWDGTSWQVVPAPLIGVGGQLWAVASMGPNDVWAVGNYGDHVHIYPMTLHWDGTSWQSVAVPAPDTMTNGLRGVVALSHNDVWAVGDYFGNVANHTLAEHWDGTSWQVVSTPGDNYEDTLNAIAAVSATDIWGVGGRVYSPPPYSISQHYSIPSNCLTPSPTSTPTISPTSTPTATPTPFTTTPAASATPTVTPTPPPLPSATDTQTASATPQPSITPTDCANGFVDINANIFYAAIHRLNCAGVINGSDARHYTPAGTATRGQFAKIVVLGFGLPLLTPINGQTFTDVPANYYAYLYIESGYHAGILSGYDPASCAAAGAVWPCYLPNVAISRAQLTKLVVGAAGYPLLTPSGGPSFSDVPPSNVFYTSIETAHAHGVVSGYPDGTFRPNQSIRRDEMAGIVYSAR